MLGLMAGTAHARVIVKTVDGLATAQMNTVMANVSGSVIKELPQQHIKIVEALGGLTDEQMVARLAKDPSVVYAEVDKLVSAAGTNDPDYGNEWHIPKIGADTAANTGNGSGVTVAVVDSGVSPVADLNANLVSGTNIVNASAGTSDVFGHGTAVAGTIAAVCNNGVGVAGVACGAKIMPVLIANSQGQAYLSDIATGIRWAADHGAQVINVSYDGMTGSQTIDDAANYARSKNASVVTAAGNSGNNPGFTSNDPYLFTVAATDSSDSRASFSSYGPYVDIAAPGTMIWTTDMNGSYGTWEGTSFASPIVAAVEAMMLSVNHNLTPDQRENILRNTAVDLGASGYDQYYGYGRVNAAAAVQAAANGSSTQTSPPPPAQTTPIASPAPIPGSTTPTNGGTTSSGSGGGGGCALSPSGKFDPLLPALLASALVVQVIRRRRK